MRWLMLSLCWLCLLVSSLTLADERILSYVSRIEVKPDGGMEVTETIRVRAEGDAIRRGIFREFPTTYSDRRGGRVTVGFTLLSVRRDGGDEAHRLERRGNGVRIYIGQEEVFLSPGEYSYQIRYRTDRQLGFFDNHDELYWNVTGNDWAFPIDEASAKVLLPNAVPLDAVHMEAYTGPMGAKGRDYRAAIEDSAAQFFTTASLAPREGLTIVVTWPKGFVAAPSEVDRARHLLRDNQPLAFATAALAALLAYYVLVWNLVGRDPPGAVVIPRYRPPESESPASMRYVQNMAYDDRCFAAGVLSLAVKGYVLIEQAAKGLIKRGKYTLTRRQGSTTPLAVDENPLLRELFSSGQSIELDDENHSVIGAARKAHEKALKQKYHEHFFRINRGWHTLGWVLSLLIPEVVALVIAPVHGFGAEWFFTTLGGGLTIALFIAGLVANFVFGGLLKAPTRAGRRLLDEIAGFRQYLDVAEGDEIKLAGAPRKTPSLFESYLPFALALGVEQHWAEQFATVFRTQALAHSPDWYRGDQWDANDLGDFSSAVGSSLSSAISSAATPPGSSSGSGGGGSSGGGGGGGGGGGW